MDFSHTPLAYRYGKAYAEPYRRIAILQADRNAPETVGHERDTHIRRAVMCWNACLSLTEDELTTLGHDGVARKVRALEADVTKLRGTLIDVRPRASGMAGLLSEILSTGALDRRGDDDLIDRVKQAIADQEAFKSRAVSGGLDG